MFDSHIRDHAHVTPRATAVVTPLRTVCYADFNSDIDRLGAGLAALGLDEGVGVVSVNLANPYLRYVALAALARLRIASSPFNDDGADVRLGEGDGAAADDWAGARRLDLTPGWISAVLTAEARPLPILELDPEAVGRVMLSSGTTHTPRRIAMTWRRMAAINIANLCSRGAGVHGTWIPLTSVEAIQGFCLAISAWSQGAALTGGISAIEAPAILETRPQGLVGCTPVQLATLLKALPAGFAPQPGWRISVGGARLPADLAREARLRLTPDVRITYGATEATLNTFGPAADLEAEPYGVGYPLGGVIIEVFDDDGRKLEDGQPGEIRIRGDRVASGYLDDPEATAERFQDGWFHTRDIGRRLADGRIVLDGRVDDRMNLEGGWKFMPGALEDAARACPGVVECAAFAVPRGDGFDQCWLAVTAVSGFERESLARHLSGYSDLPPVHVGWIAAIPRTTTGKVERRALRDLVLATQGQAGG